MSGPDDSIAIIGAGIAGATAAIQLREHDFQGKISLIGEEPWLPYDRPPLSKGFLKRSIDREDLKLYSAEEYESAGIELVLGQKARQVVPQGGVQLADGSRVEAGRVLLTTGLRARSLHVPGGQLRGVVTLRGIQDAEVIRSSVAQGDSVVVIGAGFVGSEVAATLRELGADVVVVDAAALPLQPTFGASAGGWLAEQHQAHGVRYLGDKAVRAIVGRTHVESVTLTDGSTLRATLVVVAIGSTPNVEVAEASGVATDNGIIVGPSGETSVPGVYAAGDVALFYSRTFGRRIRIEHWRHAQDHPASVVGAMLGAPTDYDAVPWAWTELYGQRWEVAGLPAMGPRVALRGHPADEGGAAWAFTDHEDRLWGAVALGRRHELRAIRRALRGTVHLRQEQFIDRDADIATAIVVPAIELE
jgi:3-phenylpropionate/trans-cinnamate dioxygenase ferredoxin reductase subunit